MKFVGYLLVNLKLILKLNHLPILAICSFSLTLKVMPWKRENVVCTRNQNKTYIIHVKLMKMFVKLPSCWRARINVRKTLDFYGILHNYFIWNSKIIVHKILPVWTFSKYLSVSKNYIKNSSNHKMSFQSY